MGTPTSGNPFAAGTKNNRGNTVLRHLGENGVLEPEQAAKITDHLNAEATYNDSLYKQGAAHLTALHAHATNLYHMTGSPFAANAMDSAAKALKQHDSFNFSSDAPGMAEREDGKMHQTPGAVSSFDHVHDAFSALKSLKSETTMTPDAHPGVAPTLTRAGDSAISYINMYHPTDVVPAAGGKAKVSQESDYRKIINVDPKANLPENTYKKTKQYEENRKLAGNKKVRPLKTGEMK